MKKTIKLFPNYESYLVNQKDGQIKLTIETNVRFEHKGMNKYYERYVQTYGYLDKEREDQILDFYDQLMTQFLDICYNTVYLSELTESDKESVMPVSEAQRLQIKYAIDYLGAMNEFSR